MRKDNECSLVCDLLPLFLDGLTGEESNSLIQSHMQTCQECNDYHAALVSQRQLLQQTELTNSRKLKRMLLRYKYETIGLISGSLVVIIGLVLLIAIPYFRNQHQDSYTVSEHLEQTTDYGIQDYTGISALALFPDSTKMTGSITEFYYDCKGNKLYQEYQIYLQCVYDATAYQAEIDRLKAIADPDTGIATCYSEEESSCPGVYAMLYDEGYEYALFLDDQQTIVYIYLQGIDRRELSFNASLLPRDYGQYGLPYESERTAFRIYPVSEGGF